MPEANGIFDTYSSGLTGRIFGITSYSPTVSSSFGMFEFVAKKKDSRSAGVNRSRTKQALSSQFPGGEEERKDKFITFPSRPPSHVIINTGREAFAQKIPSFWEEEEILGRAPVTNLRPTVPHFLPLFFPPALSLRFFLSFFSIREIGRFVYGVGGGALGLPPHPHKSGPMRTPPPPPPRVLRGIERRDWARGGGEEEILFPSHFQFYSFFPLSRGRIELNNTAVSGRRGGEGS